MPISTPSQITVPFATSGLKNSIPSTSNPVTGNAGYDAGFPATNMTPKEAGGIPPFGQDFNGILFDITTAIRYLEAGMQFPYSSSFATAVGGYPLGAIVTRTDRTGFWRNTVANNMTDPEAFGAGWSPEGSGISTVAMSNANVTLTALQAARSIVIITGTLTASLNLIFPTYQRQWLVVNNATGAFSVTCKTASGSGVSISTGASLIVYGDGTNIVNIPLGGTGTTAPQFDNSTKFATTAFVQGVGLQFSGLISLTTNTTLTAAAHAGAMILGNSSSAFNATLPAASTMPAKTTIKFFNFGSAVMTLVCAGSDTIVNPISAATFPIPFGGSATLVSNGSNAWYMVDQSGVGVGQVWGSFLGGRFSGTTYTNSTGKPIMVTVWAVPASSGNLTLTVAGLQVSQYSTNNTTSGANGSVCAIVPNGATYSVTASAAAISGWVELR